MCRTGDGHQTCVGHKDTPNLLEVSVLHRLYLCLVFL